ncbi:MAG TPA: hypothetical protein VGG48_07755 [Rhizomicrobium sp.]|jgi:hypothetical protein
MKQLALAVALAIVLALPAVADNEAASDAAAWRVFVQMVTPVEGAKAVQFESWASDADIYGPKPGWPKVRAPKILEQSLGGVASRATLPLLRVPSPQLCAKPQDGAAGNFPASACIGEEVRHSRGVYDYLTQNNLTTTKGLVAAFAGGKPVALPMGSVVAKADWVPVTDILKWQPAYKSAAEVRRAFYTNTAMLFGKTYEFALVGVSVQSKAMPDWLWFTVEHRSNPGRCDIIGCHDGYGAIRGDVAPAATANSDYGACAKSPELLALFAKSGLAPVWNNYCLKGTQTHYVTKTGAPTILGNSVVERMNHGMPIPKISCITCHATASFDKNGTPNYAVLQRAPVGQVNPQWLTGYARGDFMWGLLSAK